MDLSGVGRAQMRRSPRVLPVPRMAQSFDPHRESLTPPARPAYHALSEIPPNVPAIVVEVLAGPQSQRLMEVGLCRDARVEVLRPGDPTLLRVNQSRLAISRSNLHSILVTHENTPPS